MKGIQYVIDSKGKKAAVLNDFKKHGELWEDFYEFSWHEKELIN